MQMSSLLSLSFTENKHTRMTHIWTMASSSSPWPVSDSDQQREGYWPLHPGRHQELQSEMRQNWGRRTLVHTSPLVVVLPCNVPSCAPVTGWLSCTHSVSNGIKTLSSTALCLCTSNNNAIKKLHITIIYYDHQHFTKMRSKNRGWESRANACMCNTSLKACMSTHKSKTSSYFQNSGHCLPDRCPSGLEMCFCQLVLFFCSWFCD